MASSGSRRERIRPTSLTATSARSWSSRGSARGPCRAQGRGRPDVRARDRSARGSRAIRHAPASRGTAYGTAAPTASGRMRPRLRRRFSRSRRLRSHDDLQLRALGAVGLRGEDDAVEESECRAVIQRVPRRLGFHGRAVERDHRDPGVTDRRGGLRMKGRAAVRGTFLLGVMQRNRGRIRLAQYAQRSVGACVGTRPRMPLGWWPAIR